MGVTSWAKVQLRKMVHPRNQLIFPPMALATRQIRRPSMPIAAKSIAAASAKKPDSSRPRFFSAFRSRVFHIKIIATTTLRLNEMPKPRRQLKCKSNPPLKIGEGL